MKHRTTSTTARQPEPTTARPSRGTLATAREASG